MGDSGDPLQLAHDDDIDGQERKSLVDGGGLTASFTPSVIVVDGNTDKRRRPIDFNSYATKKSAAEGLLDLALLMANASQLKSILMTGGDHRFYILMLTLLLSSIVLQVGVGIALLILARLRVHTEDDELTPEERVKADKLSQRADALNNWIVGGVFLLTVVNIFISSFGLNEKKVVEATVAPIQGPIPTTTLSDKIDS